MRNNAQFITSVASADKFLITNKPLVAISGKSNVGKSSLINMLAQNKKLAKTSDTPGRTRLINYFDFGDFMLADLPGYGYAKVSRSEKEKWGNLMDEFFATQKLSLVISLVDIRHMPTEDDLIMINYLYHYAMPFVLVATKADKLSRANIRPQLTKISAALKVGVGDIIASSADSGQGRSEIFSVISKSITAVSEASIIKDEI